jgi:hypothetical protein
VRSVVLYLILKVKVQISLVITFGSFAYILPPNQITEKLLLGYLMTCLLQILSLAQKVENRFGPRNSAQVLGWLVADI